MVTMDGAGERVIREHFQALQLAGWSLYRAGTEHPPLGEDEFVDEARHGRRIDMCRERPSGEIVCHSNVVIRA